MHFVVTLTLQSLYFPPFIFATHFAAVKHVICRSLGTPFLRFKSEAFNTFLICLIFLCFCLLYFLLQVEDYDRQRETAVQCEPVMQQLVTAVNGGPCGACSLKDSV